MITLPTGFTATRCPGYFWHLREKKLYSIKSGELKPIKMQQPNRFTDLLGYRVSVRGRRRTMTLDYLSRLKDKNSVIPVAQA